MRLFFQTFFLPGNSQANGRVEANQSEDTNEDAYLEILNLRNTPASKRK